ncbi:MAG: ABC transporter permease [Lachnospiraceae bacterium]|nr:ABC transporter permease [Lachnospiraceae bacterium]
MNNQVEKKQDASGILRRITKSNSFGIFIILLAMCLLLTLAVRDKFLSGSNIVSVIRQFSFYGILAIGMCMVIITAGIDLSVGSVFALAGVLACIAITKWNLPVFVSVLIGMAVGLVVGYFNGFCVTILKLPPMIATLGTMSIARGVAYTVTGGYPIGSLPDSFKFLGLGYIAGIPTPIVLMVVLAVLATLFLQKTVIGRWIYAIGGNEEGARLSGVPVNQIKRLVYALSGLMAAISGIAMAARLGVGQSTSGLSYEMDAIAATVIGGASLSGGSGSILGAIIGAAIMGVLRNGLVLLDVSAYWQQTVIGIVIILAVTLDNLRHLKKK